MDKVRGENIKEIVRELAFITHLRFLAEQRERRSRGKKKKRGLHSGNRTNLKQKISITDYTAKEEKCQDDTP